MVALEDHIQASLQVVVVLDVLDAVCICIDVGCRRIRMEPFWTSTSKVVAYDVRTGGW